MLRARINAPLPVRPELGTLDMLLAQAAVSDQRLRLDAEQFSSRLSAVVTDSAPLVVHTRKGDVPLLAQYPIAEPRTSVGFHPPSADQIVGSRPVAPTPQFPVPQRPRPGTEPAAIARSFAATRPAAPRGFEALPPDRPPRRQRIVLTSAAILVVLAGLAGGAVWKLGLFASKHAVPVLTNMTMTQAAQKLSGDGFTLSVARHAPSNVVPVNEIISQSPVAGTSGKSGLAITVILSSGPILVTLPTSLIGETCAAATAKLHALKLAATCNQTMASTRLASGLVAEVLSHSTKNPLAVPAHSIVNLVVSTGPGTTTTTTVAATTTTTAPTGSTTTTTTTTIAGEGLRAMPNVVGMDQAQVYAAMRKAQLFFSTRGPGAGTTKWTTVVSEVPAAGTSVKWHSNVILNVK